MSADELKALVGKHQLREASQAAVERLKGMVGQTMTDRGFVSTTTSRHQAVKWMKNVTTKGDVLVAWEIRMPQGSKGLWLESAVGDQTRYKVQKELLLGRGAQFRIVAVEEDVKTGIINVIVEFIGYAGA